MNEGAYRSVERELWCHSCGARPEEQGLQLSTWGARVRAQVLGEGESVLFLHGGLRPQNATCAVADFLGSGTTAGTTAVPTAAAWGGTR